MLMLRSMFNPRSRVVIIVFQPPRSPPSSHNCGPAPALSIKPLLCRVPPPIDFGISSNSIGCDILQVSLTRVTQFYSEFIDGEFTERVRVMTSPVELAHSRIKMVWRAVSMSITPGNPTGGPFGVPGSMPVQQGLWSTKSAL